MGIYTRSARFLKLGNSHCVLFNERENNLTSTIYGIVTTGTHWKFFKLSDKIVFIDLNEYYLKDLENILGIFAIALQEE